MSKSNKNIKRKQPTLAAFNFTKRVKHRGEMTDVQMLLEVIETPINCKICDKTFKNEQGLGSHSKTVHGVIVSKASVASKEVKSKPPQIFNETELTNKLPTKL